MKHPEDHEIERYAQGADPRNMTRTEMAAHLEECAGCRSLAMEMEHFYLSLEEEFQQTPISETTGSSVVQKHRKDLVKLYQEDRAPVTFWRPPVWIALAHRIYTRHPYAVGSASLGVVGAMAFALFLFLKPAFFRDNNPVVAMFNEKKHALEVLNGSGDVIWSVVEPTKDLYSQPNTSRFDIADIAGDGHNEIILAMNDSETLRSAGRPEFGVFSSERKPLFVRSFASIVQYRGAEYTSDFRIDQLFHVCFDEKRTDIFILYQHYRSPAVLVRYNSSGDVIGEYWHFGHVGAFQVVNKGNRPLLLLAGLDDAEEGPSGSDKSEAFILLLDPEQVVGRTECSATAGFGFPISPAERRYLKAGRDILAISSGTELSFNTIQTTHNTQGTQIRATLANGVGLQYDFYLSPDWAIANIVQGESNENIYNDLVPKGKLPPNRFNTIIPQLRSTIRYWNGKSWQKGPCEVENQVAIH